MQKNLANSLALFQMESWQECYYFRIRNSERYWIV